MDDNAVYGRPFNHRASALLGRPNTHGPVLVMKTISLRIGIDVHDFEEQKGVIPPHLIGWERVTEDELRSPEFKEKRRLWIKREARAAQELLSSDLLKDFQVINL